jgi:hypothetical protein
MLKASLLLLALMCSSQASAQVRTGEENEAAAALEGVLVAIRELGRIDAHWRLDSVFAISYTRTTLGSYAGDSSLVRRVLGPSGRIGLSARHIDKCPLNREGAPINGCDRVGGLQTFFINGRVGSADGKDLGAMFVVSISRVGPQADSSSREGTSWIFRMARGEDGKYRLRDRPDRLIH